MVDAELAASECGADARRELGEEKREGIHLPKKRRRLLLVPPLQPLLSASQPSTITGLTVLRRGLPATASLADPADSLLAVLMGDILGLSSDLGNLSEFALRNDSLRPGLVSGTKTLDVDAITHILLANLAHE